MRSPTARPRYLALLSGILLATALPLRASPADPLLFVLDASGSMWGRLGDGRAKIETAREVLRDVLGELPPGSAPGLMAYGHNRKGDCGDIELLLAPAPGTADQLAALVRQLIPRGKTPIAEALRQAGEALAQDREAESATLVLISDGIETCDGDPCATAEAIHSAGADLKVFVVGFDVASHEREQLACIASQGGGRYFDAADAGALSQALTNIRRTLAEPQSQRSSQPDPPPMAKPRPKPAPARPAPHTTPSDTKRVKIQGPGTIRLQPAPWVRLPPRAWTLIDAETGESVGTGQGESIRTRPGLYQIRWQQSEHASSPVALTEVVEVESGGQVPVALDTGLRITPPEGLRAPDYWELRALDGAPVARFGDQEAFEPQLVPAGLYRLIWRQSEHGAPEVSLGELELPTGRLTERVLDTGVVLAPPDWLEAPYAFGLTDAAGRKYWFSETGPLPLAPGSYRLVWRQTEHGHSPIDWGDITISAGGYRPLPVDSGITFTPFGDRPPYRLIFRNQTSGQVSVLSDSFGPMPLPPGTYAIELQETQHGSTPLTLVEDLVLEPGMLLELEM